MAREFYPLIEDKYTSKPPRAFHQDLTYFLSEMLVDEGDGPTRRFPDDRLTRYNGMLYDLVISGGNIFTNGPKRTGDFDTDFNNALKYLQKLEALAYKHSPLFDEGELKFGAGTKYENKERKFHDKNYTLESDIEETRKTFKEENLDTYKDSFIDPEKFATDSLNDLNDILGDKDISTLKSSHKKALKNVNIEKGINKAFESFDDAKLNGINKDELKSSVTGLRGNALDKKSMGKVIELYNKLVDKHIASKKPNFFEKLFNMKAARVYNTQQKAIDSIVLGMNLRGISTESFLENAKTNSLFTEDVNAKKENEARQLDGNASKLVAKQNKTMGIIEPDSLLPKDEMTQNDLNDRLNNTFANIDKSIPNKTSGKYEQEMSKNIDQINIEQKGI